MIAPGVTIEKMAAEGKCIGHLEDGRVVFVPYSAPGDVADLLITRSKHSHAEGLIDRLITPSDRRREPVCPHFGLCGGCKWQHVPYEMQLQAKEQQVYDQLTRIGKVTIGERRPILGCERELGYRNKLEFTFSSSRWITEEERDRLDGEAVDERRGLGFHIPGRFDKVLDIRECYLMDEIDAILAGFRAESDRYLYDSFTTITGYNANGAIVHYHPMPDTSAKIMPKGSLLLDSGAQYYDGTTDITRTVSLDGKPSEKLRHDYTLVLKGHIDLQLAVFPKGTRGNQLDVLAHRYLWQEHKNYGHGTGHGVGHFLCCHEGPQNFRTDNNPSPIRLHSVTSDEPGYYPEGEYGIRIENLLRCIKVGEGGGEEFYGFECLTLCWLDNRMVDPSMLDDAQLRWYNDYQERVYREISPELDEETAKWLRDHTLPLER